MSETYVPQPPLVVIAGPTAVGKTALAIDLAEQGNGEIVNADSRSFYRGMDIGTAKPTMAERSRVPHHLVDILDPADEMSLAHFQRLAFGAIDAIAGRGNVPFLVGGTAQYLSAVVENWSIPEVAPNPAMRAGLEARMAAEGVEPLLDELRRIDPESADRTGPNPRRIIRALEVHAATGQPMTRLMGKRPPRYRTIGFELWLPREVLHARIRRRTEQHLATGLIEEVAALLAAGIDPGVPAFSSIGYREVLPHLRGERTMDETLEAIVHGTNRLVRHQQTWFRKIPWLERIDMTQERAEADVQARIARFLSNAS